MAIIDWDETPSAGDCFDDTSWSNMVTYIKHSHSCDFIIYDDESSTSQKFKFSYAGNDNTLEGDDTTGKSLILKATSADAYPYITLTGNADIKEYFKAGNAFYLYDSAVQAFKMKYAANISTIEGGHASGDVLILKANDIDTYPKITLTGNGSISCSVKSGDAFYFYYNTTTFGNFTSDAADWYISSAANRNIVLNPHGAGYVKFGTYSAKGAEAFDGFITMKDAAGNIRKIMTCA